MASRTEDLRTIALIGHGHSGKTSLVEAMLRAAKGPGLRGAVDVGGNGLEPEEKERKHTLVSHLHRIDVHGVRVQLLDTPGHPDFVADAISALHCADIACLVVSAATPLSFHARQLWRAAGEAGRARAIVVTHLDHDGTDFHAFIGSLRTTLGHAVAPVTYPVAVGAKFEAIRDVLTHHSPRADQYHDWIEEDEAEVDDTVLSHYLEKGHLDAAEFDQYLARAMASGKLVPVFAVDPIRGIGVDAWLRFLAEHAPSSLACEPRLASKRGQRKFEEPVEAREDGAFLAQVYKVVVDPFLGRLAHMRCLRGAVRAGQSLVVVRTGKPFVAAHLVQGNGKDAENIDRVVAGELFAVAKVEDLAIGDAVAVEGALLDLPRPAFPAPCYSRHVWPKSRADEAKIGSAIEKLCAEDPTLLHRRDRDTGELLLDGMSPMHLEVQLQRMHRRWQVAVDSGAPAIPYRETVTARAGGHHRHKKQTGGRGQFAEVFGRVMPLKSGEGFAFVDAVVGGSVPRQFVPEVEKGARKFLQRGALAGFPVVDVSFELHDGKHHDVDSDQLSFQIAGERAFADAFAKARPVLLEPVMRMQIHVPERCTGDVAASLSGMRGRLLGMSTDEDVQHIETEAPLASLLDFATQLRSMTAGEGSFRMEFDRYEQVPAAIQAEIVKQRRAAVEAAHAAHQQA